MKTFNQLPAIGAFTEEPVVKVSVNPLASAEQAGPSNLPFNGKDTIVELRPGRGKIFTFLFLSLFTNLFLTLFVIQIHTGLGGFGLPALVAMGCLLCFVVGMIFSFRDYRRLQRCLHHSK